MHILLLVISSSDTAKVISTFLDIVHVSLTSRRRFLIIALCVHYPALLVLALLLHV